MLLSKGHCDQSVNLTESVICILNLEELLVFWETKSDTDSLVVPFTLLNLVCKIFEHQSELEVTENTNVLGRISFQTVYVLIREKDLISVKYYQLQVGLYFCHYVYYVLYIILFKPQNNLMC